MTRGLSAGSADPAAIEQAARKLLFAERGFHGTTLGDITSAVQAVAGVVHRYFDDKGKICSRCWPVVPALTCSPGSGPTPVARRHRLFTAAVTGYWNIFKQNLDHGGRRAQLGATQPRFADVQRVPPVPEWTSCAPRCCAPREQGYAADPDPDHIALAISLLFENFTTVYRGPTPPRSACRAHGCRRRAPGDHLEENRLRKPGRTWILQLPGTFRVCWPRWTRSSRPRSNRSNASTCSALRPASGVRPDRSGQWRHPTARVGDLLDEMRRRADAAAGCATAAAEGVRWSAAPTSTWPSSGNTWRNKGSRPAQRPAGRVLDRRQLPTGHHDEPVRH